MRSIVSRAKRGMRRSVLIDGRGVPVAGVLDGANCNDHKLMRETLDAIALPRPKTPPDRPQHLCLDKGDDHTNGPSLRPLRYCIRSAAVIASRLQRGIGGDVNCAPVWQPLDCRVASAPRNDRRGNDKRGNDRRRQGQNGHRKGPLVSCQAARDRSRVRPHPASAHPRRGGHRQTPRRSPGAPMGGRTPFLAQPLPRHPDPLEQEAREPPRLAPLRLRHHRLATGPTGIGPQPNRRRCSSRCRRVRPDGSSAPRPPKPRQHGRRARHAITSEGSPARSPPCSRCGRCRGAAGLGSPIGRTARTSPGTSWA